MIQLFHIPNHKIDTSNYSHSLHDKRVEELEKKIADYVGAKYACAVNSATNAIFLIMRDKRPYARSRMVVDLPSMIPPVVANAILTSGFHNEINFTDDILEELGISEDMRIDKPGKIEDYDERDVMVNKAVREVKARKKAEHQAFKKMAEEMRKNEEKFNEEDNKKTSE